ncbi:MAG: hypothetical protein Q9160_001588 [Pyrenula sp. 1 TL-2023]
MSLEDSAVQQAFADASGQQYLVDASSEATPNDTSESATPSQNQNTSNSNHEIWTQPAPKSRGRAPNDPNGKKIILRCQSVEDLENHLGHYLAEPSHPPAHTTLEFHYGMEAAFIVAKVHLKPHMSPSEAKNAPFSEKTVVSVMNALSYNEDQKEMKYKQRAIAKACAEAIMRTDHYKYSYNNEWVSKEDQASRISYYCNDSTSNKMRSVTAAKKTQGKRAAKPVYDCGGYIAVKFSAVKQNLEVTYKHNPVHKTYDERAPIPRRGSKRRRLMEMYNPEALPTPRKEKTDKSTPKPKAAAPTATPSSKQTQNASRKRKAPQSQAIDPAMSNMYPQVQAPAGAPFNHSPQVQQLPPPPHNHPHSHPPTLPLYPPNFHPSFQSPQHQHQSHPHSHPPPPAGLTATPNNPALQTPSSTSTASPSQTPYSHPHPHPHPNTHQQVQPMHQSPLTQPQHPSPQIPLPRQPRGQGRRPRLSAAQQRATKISAARSEVDIMREKLAEAEANVHRLEAENRLIVARGGGGRGGGVAVAGVGGGVQGGGGSGGVGAHGIPVSEMISEVPWNVFTPATYGPGPRRRQRGAVQGAGQGQAAGPGVEGPWGAAAAAGVGGVGGMGNMQGGVR